MTAARRRPCQDRREWATLKAMAFRRQVVGYGLSVASWLFVSVASAQDSATAGALFEKGVADLEAGRFESACPAIEESQRIDPRPGTLFTLAECHARWGKVASAAAQYQEYVDLVSRLTPEQQQRHKLRADAARAQLVKLKPSVPTLTLLLPADAPPGTFVTRNGELLKGVALGLPLPADPGEYVIVTHVPGRAERETKVRLELGEAKRVLLEASGPASEPGAPPAPISAPPVALPDTHGNAQAGHPQPPGKSHRTAAYVAGGVGVAGLVVGSITGILVLEKKHTVSNNCSFGSCNDAGLNAANGGKHLAVASDVGFGVGIAGLAVSAVLLLTGGSDSAVDEHSGETRFRPVLTGHNGLVSAGLFRRW